MKSSTDSSWWGRNWKWVVPMGCLGSVALIGACVVGATYLLFTGMRSTGAYQEALERARHDQRVIAALGEPIEPGWFVTGTVNITGPTGEADMAIPIAGPDGSGTLYVVARKSAGEWRFERLEVAVEGREGRIDLLGPHGEGEIITLLSRGPGALAACAAPERSGG